MSARRVILIGLDAFDPALARELAASGRLPAIAELLETGATAETKNPYGFVVGAVWPTLFTSRSVTETGFHCWEEIVAGTYERRLTSPNELGAPPFWRVISESGRRVAAIDVPHARAGERFDGIEISEWGCHDRHFGLATSPPELAREIEDRFGLHPVFGIDGHAEREFAPDDYFARAGDRRTLDEERRLASELIAGARAKTALSLELLGRSDWDLFVSIFGESHAIGHQLWHVHDRGHPEHDPGRAAALGDPVVELYRELDRALAAHLESAGPETTVIALLSHGMAQHFDGTHMLHEVLRRIDARDRGLATVVGGVAERAYARLPATARRVARSPMAAMLRRRDVAVYEGFGVEERNAQRFFNSPNNTVYGGIRINLAGREPDGIVEPGAELDRICERLADDLLELVNVDTGAPAVDRVTRTDEHYERRSLDALPDLLVDWNRSGPIEKVWSPKTGVVHAPYRLWRTGDHRLDGLLVARGPGIEAGPKPPIAALDLAPSIASRLGVELASADGEPVAWLAGARAGG